MPGQFNPQRAGPGSAGAVAAGPNGPALPPAPARPVPRPGQIIPRPNDTGPTRTFPDPSRKTTLGGTGDVRRPPNEPFIVPVEVSAVTQVIFHAVRALGGQQQQQPGGGGRAAADGTLTVNPELGLTRMNPENVRREWEIQAQRQAVRDFLGPLGDFLFGQTEGKALKTGIGGGFLARRAGGGLASSMLGGDPLGGGEEDALARRNAALKDMRERAAKAIFALLTVRPRAGGGPVLVMQPMEEADP